MIDRALERVLDNPALRRLDAYVRLRLYILWRMVRGRPAVALAVRTVREMSDDDATHMAAGVAYYAIFSLFPLFIGIIAIFNLMPASQVGQSTFSEVLSNYLPGSESLFVRNVEVGGALGVFALFGLLWSASAIFGAVTRVVNRAWDVHKDRPLFVSKPRQMIMALTVGVLFGTSMAAAAFVRAAEQYAGTTDLTSYASLVEFGGRLFLLGASFVLSLMTFLLMYKLLPNTKTYWRYVWPGAIVAAVLFELGKAGFLFYLERFANFESVYGSLGDVVVLLMWVYVSSLILILGAELSSEYGRMKEGVGRGVLLHPRK